ncbi:3-methyl-2-oxobutanoate hydroxymethyltransferase [Bacillus xiapuensis]|uniref:3-methyl-2-oxobutanoate hydroxymethyltransferase n=1 Tax=Bacillus xiapuensis TaxID=2014075 RepID=UPI000C23A6A3|nr:3-methyl-2-oxobutanoate hydroxymethyltransferase [Bacillus xiapuensis]
MKQTTDFIQMKAAGEKIVMVTAYDYPSAKYAEAAKTDLILVGDSLGMVVLGYPSTIPVTLDDMVHHTKAVKRGAKDTFIVTDLPFMTYHISREETMRAAQRLLQEAGAHAIKLEGGKEVVKKVRLLTEAGVPAVAHLGLTPQSVGVLGGYKVQGKTAASAAELMEEAKRLEAAGACMLVLECVPRQLAAQITKAISIPVIGIGAGGDTDGQVLVYHDLIRYGVDRIPKFVKAYGDVGPVIDQALSSYVKDVKAMKFPAKEQAYSMKEEEWMQLYGGMQS